MTTTQIEKSLDIDTILAVPSARPKTENPARQRRQPARPFPVPDRPHVVCLLPGLYQVGGGYLSHSRDAASYLLLDERTGESILVDCGSHCGLPAVRANIAAVANLKKLQLVIGTHGHWDHVDAYAHMRDEISAPIALHEADAQAVETADPDLTCAGWLYNETFHAFPIDQRLKGGEHFQIGDFDIEVWHLPGHSPGCIGLYTRYARTGQTILIPGDSVQGGYSKRIRSNVTAWRRSLRRLMQNPPDLMLPNHLPPGSQTSLLGDVPNRLARVYSLLETDFYDFQRHQRTEINAQF